jgi:hypothetical protein
LFFPFLYLGALLYTSCVLGLHPSALFIEFLLIKKKNYDSKYENSSHGIINKRGFSVFSEA